jgi:hypothetical protein
MIGGQQYVCSSLGSVWHCGGILKLLIYFLFYFFDNKDHPSFIIMKQRSQQQFAHQDLTPGHSATHTSPNILLAELPITFSTTSAKPCPHDLLLSEDPES